MPEHRITSKVNEYGMSAREIVFEVTESPDGGYEARAVGHSILTQGDDWVDLKDMARDAVRCHFDGEAAPRIVRLHVVRNKAFAV